MWCVCEHTFSTEEFARDVEGLSSDDDDLLAVQKLLCNCAGETTEQVSLAVDDNDWLKGRHIAPSSPCSLSI
jgi:hypothetical protein